MMSNRTDAAANEAITAIDVEFERVEIADNVSTANATNRFGRVTII